MGPERRFVLLLLCSLVLLSALGALLRRSSAEPAPAVASDAPQHEVTKPARDALAPQLATMSRTPLASLWSTDVRDRAGAALLIQPGEGVVGNKQIISYYGNPYTPKMGVLGTADLETIASDLEQHAGRYDELNGAMDVVPAIHLVYAVAQYYPTGNGLSLQYVADEDVQRYIELTMREGMLLFLDLQIGHSSVSAEVRKALPYLRYPHVHLAIDPEFAVAANETPGADLGSLPAADIDRAQAMLQELVAERGLPPKVLIVHQFADSMLTNADAIGRYAGVELIVDMDGFGMAAVKRAKYEQIAGRPYAQRAGIKLFFEHDPDLMSEEDVLALRPAPTVVIYQ